MKNLLFHSAFCILHSAFVLFFVSPCAGQTIPLGNDTVPYGQRTDAFRRLLHELNFKPLTTFAELQESPDESLLIVLGDPRCLSRAYLPEGLATFVEHGGAVLIATDNRTAGEAGENLTRLAGVTVTGELLACQNPESLYKNFGYSPFVQPLEANNRGGTTNVLGALAAVVGTGGRPDLFRDPHPDQPPLRVATNAPSRLRLQRSWRPLPLGIHRLAHLPRGCFEPSNPPRSLWANRNFGSEEPLFAVGGDVDKGRVLVLADHSIFINRMILPRDTGNLEFAANCLHWLRGGISTPTEALRASQNPQALEELAGRRNKVLFWDDGVIRKDFKVPLKTVPLKPTLDSEPVIVAAVDQAITRLESRNVFNRKIEEMIHEQFGGWARFLRKALYVLTLVSLLLASYLSYRYLRHRHDATVPLLQNVVRGHTPRGSVLEQRRRALLRSGNVWETAHQLARECFESAGISLSAGPPRPVLARGSWWQRWRLRRRITRLWHLARGDAPTPIPPATLQHCLHDLEQLKAGLAEGKLQLMLDA